MKLIRLITDIDNTIADTTRRMRRSLREMGREEVFVKTSDQFGGFSDYLSPEELEELWKLFLSEKYLHLDKPAPGAADFLSGCVDDGLKVTYLTGRHDQQGDTMRPGTEDWLAENGFPLPDQNRVMLFMKPRRKMNDRQFKLKLLERELSSEASGGVVGIGDHPDDALVYSKVGVKPIMLNWQGLFSRRELKAPAEGIKVVENWADMEKEFGVLRSG